MAENNIRLGILVIHNDPVPESEFWRGAPSGVTIHAARFETPRASGEEFVGLDPERLFRITGMARAIDHLADLGVHAIGYCFTSSSVFEGLAFDEAFEAEVSRLAGCIPVLTAGHALKDAVERVPRDRYLVVAPPWFTDATVDATIEYLRLPPYRTESVRYELPESWDSVARPDRFDAGARNEISTDGLVALVEKSHPPAGTLVVIPGGGFHSLRAADRLWSRHGIRTLSANRALLDTLIARAAPDRVSVSALRKPV